VPQGDIQAKSLRAILRHRGVLQAGERELNAARRGCWRERAITSEVGSDMEAWEVFMPNRIEKYAEAHMSSGAWPGTSTISPIDQERLYAATWQHVARATERHSSLGDDDKSPLEVKLAAMLQ
jgi:hypothetical protein